MYPLQQMNWTEKLDDEERIILIHACLLSGLLSLDTLANTTQAGVIKILQFLDRLVNEDLLTPSRANGSGYYRFTDRGLADGILAQVDPSELQDAAKKLISHLESSQGKDPEKYEILGRLYRLTGLPIKGMTDLLNMAEYYRSQNQMEKAVTFYQSALEDPLPPQQPLHERKTYIDAALGLAATREFLVSAEKKKGFLKRARQIAIELDDMEREAKVNMIYAHIVCRSEGNLKKAGPLYQRAWELATNIGNEDLLREAVLMSIDFLCWQGRVAEAVKRYEEAIGNLEKLPSDEVTLRACALLGWCFGICGKTARGIGLIRNVREKTEELGLPRIKNYADIMAVLTLLEARHIQEASTYLEKILQAPEDNLEYFVIWMAFRAKAYLLFKEGNPEDSFHYLKRAQEHSQRYGWPQYRGSWNLECIEGLEKAGMIHSKINLESEIRLLLKWPDIYMKGVALRYRAKQRLKTGDDGTSVIKDLNKSLNLLTRSGASLEAAKTKIMLARHLFREREEARATRLLGEAWEVISPVNRNLFPRDLLKHILNYDREERIIRTIVEVGNSLGTVRNLRTLLDQIISLIMGFTAAERGGVFLTSKKGLEMVAGRNLNLDDVQSRRFKLKLQLIERVARSGKELVHGIGQPGPGRGDIPEGIPDTGWMICSPILLKKKVLGVFYLDSDNAASALTLQDLKLLGAINNQIGISLDNVRAYEEISRLRDRLKEETRFFRMEPSSPLSTGQIVGKSDVIREVLNEMEKVAPTDSSVLITGETGVGKEMVARGIHQLSRRSEGPFIPVNMASLSEGLIPSELFGHERGAFTGADKRRIGRMELAHEGTLFLDDVQNIPLDIQAKLLRAIEEKGFERVGGTEIIHSDFRLLAATNIPLEEMVEKGLFRSDLFYRLNVFPVFVKPLRDRKEDIPPLVLHFLEVYKKRFSKDQIRGISEGNMKRLKEYPWSGNVRELKHVVERAVILSEGKSLHLPSLITLKGKKEARPEPQTMKEMERAHIIATLNKCAWKVSGEGGAAQLLDLKPQTLYSKMRKLGIQRKVTHAE